MNFEKAGIIFTYHLIRYENQQQFYIVYVGGREKEQKVCYPDYS